jgi:spermidine synthase
VVAWNRTVLGHLAGRPLEDPRVRLHQGDVAALLDAPARPFDVILLDVDNGPEEVSLASNRHLYSREGVRRMHGALAPGGVLAFWSASPDADFARRLRKGGYAVETRRVRERAEGKGGRHAIFLARPALAGEGRRRASPGWAPASRPPSSRSSPRRR